MANSITAAPSVLAAGVLSALQNKLPVLSGISSVFSARPGSTGMSIQVPLIGTSSATTFGSGGYLTQDDATITSATVSLTQYKISSRFTPSNLKDYGADFFVQNFTQTASIGLAQKVMDVINAQVTAANYSVSSTSGADLSYSELVGVQKTLDDAKAPSPRYPCSTAPTSPTSARTPRSLATTSSALTSSVMATSVSSLVLASISSPTSRPTAKTSPAGSLVLTPSPSLPLSLTAWTSLVLKSRTPRTPARVSVCRCSFSWNSLVS